MNRLSEIAQLLIEFKAPEKIKTSSARGGKDERTKKYSWSSELAARLKVDSRRRKEAGDHATRGTEPAEIIRSARKAARLNSREDETKQGRDWIKRITNR